MCIEVELKLVYYLLSLLRQPVFVYKWQHGALHRSQRLGQLEHHARCSVLQLLLCIRVAHHAEEHTVYADRRLNVIGSVALVGLRVEVLNLCAGEFLMLRQVVVGTAVNAFHLFEAEGHTELDVGSGVGIVCQLLMVVETIVLVAHAQGLVPLQAMLLPVVEPLHLRSGLAEELHLHLLKLTHTEHELACHNLVSEGLSYLRYAEGQLHAARLLHVEEVDKDALSRLRTQVDAAGSLGRGAHLGREHQVELPYIGPVLSTADGVYDAFVQDNLLQLGQVGSLHGGSVAGVQGVALLLMVEHAGVGGTKLSLVEVVAEAFAGLGHLLVYLLVILGYLVLYEVVGTVALLRVTVVYQRVVESIHVTAGLPHRGVHEDRSVDAHNVAVQQHHRLPPVLLDVVFQLNAVLSVVVNG